LRVDFKTLWAAAGGVEDPEAHVVEADRSRETKRRTGP
jgi:hypothetical protein